MPTVCLLFGVCSSSCKIWVGFTYQAYELMPILSLRHTRGLEPGPFRLDSFKQPWSGRPPRPLPLPGIHIFHIPLPPNTPTYLSLCFTPIKLPSSRPIPPHGRVTVTSNTPTSETPTHSLEHYKVTHFDSLTQVILSCQKVQSLSPHLLSP